MSNRALTWAFEQPIDNPGRKFVLVALADKADEDNSCWPSQASIAAMTGQTDRSVRRHLAQLEADGLITRRSVYRDGHRTSDRYVLQVGVLVSIHKPPAIPDNLSGSKADTVSGMTLDLPDTQSGMTLDLPDTVSVHTGQVVRVTQREPSLTNSASSSRTRGTRLSANWQPTPELVAWARGEGVSVEQGRAWTEDFRDYWLAKAGSGGVKLDWGATWRRWIRTEAKRAGCRPPSAQLVPIRPINTYVPPDGELENPPWLAAK